MTKKVKFEGKVYQFPDDASDDEIRSALSGQAAPQTQAAPAHQPTFLERIEERTKLPIAHPIEDLKRDIFNLSHNPGETLKQTFTGPSNPVIGARDLAYNTVTHPIKTWRDDIAGGPQFAKDVHAGNWKGAAGTLVGDALPIVTASPEVRAAAGVPVNIARNATATALDATAKPVGTIAGIAGAAHELGEGMPWSAGASMFFGRPAITRGMREMADFVRPAKTGREPFPIVRPMMDKPAFTRFAAGAEDAMEAPGATQEPNLATPALYRMSGDQITDAATVTPRPIFRPKGLLPASTEPPAARMPQFVSDEDVLSHITGEGAGLELPRVIKRSPLDLSADEIISTSKRGPIRPAADILSERRAGGWHPESQVRPLMKANQTLQEFNNWKRMNDVVNEMNDPLMSPEELGRQIEREMAQPGSWASKYPRISRPPETDLTDVLRRSIQQAEANKAAAAQAAGVPSFPIGSNDPLAITITPTRPSSLRPGFVPNQSPRRYLHPDILKLLNENTQ